MGFVRSLRVLALLLAFFSPIPGLAQQPAVLSGRASDSSGAALPGVAVTITASNPPGSQRTVVTDRNGDYRVPDLAPGQYEITAELTGFRTVRRSISLTGSASAAAATRADVTLDVAGLAEAVIVRGARVSRSLLETAASVDVTSAAALEQRPLITSAVDLLTQVPNVTSTGTSNLAPAIRGADGTGPAQGADAFFAGTRPRLNIQVDGRPASYNEVVFGDSGLWDVEQVEMFRGAQSTVQGRNAMAGTLVVKTKDPTFDPEGKLRFTVGNFGTRQVSGALSGPIVSEKIAARIAFDRQTSDSFAEGFTGYQGVDNPADFETLTVRGKVLIQPDAAKRFSTLLTINHANAKGPQTEQIARPFEDHQASYPNQPVFEPRTTGVVAETRYAFNGQTAYEHTLAFTDVQVERRAVPGDGNALIDGRELVFEPRVRFASSNRRVQGFAGVYLFHGTQDESIDLFGGGLFDDETNTAAGFGEVTIALPKQLELTLAGRFEREHRERAGSDGPFTIAFDETYNVFSPKVGLQWRASPTFTLGTVVSRGYNGGGAGFTYDFPFVSYTFEPEYVWTSENYVRADLADGKVSLTGNVFYSRYQDMQLPFDLNPDPSIWAFVVRNADAVVTYGSELGATWRAMPSLELFGNVGLLRAEITDYPGSSVQGNELPRAPSASLLFGARYRDARGFDGSLEARVAGAYFSSVTNDPFGKTDSYGYVNAQVGYTIRGSGTRIFVYAKNLFDSAAATILEPGSTRAEDVATILQPRRAGLGISWGF
jgi:iron complex outermembrane recepter protein